MKKSNIYTQTGDKGTTSLVGGVRVAKTDLRLEAYGTVDELNAHLGVLHPLLPPQEADRELVRWVQHKLFSVGSLLATEEDSPFREHLPALLKADVERLENRIDEIDQLLPPLQRFVLPGGSRAAGEAHICRTVCRRAERRICEVTAHYAVEPELIRFINRLSDYLFVLARFSNVKEQCDEIFWEKSC